MKILVINGPNLNMLGKRPSEYYGTKTLAEINSLIIDKCRGRAKLEFVQTNYEGEIVDVIQKASTFNAIIINPAAYTHTSIAIRDALEIYDGIKCEVHLSDINNRDDFRRINYIKDVCDKSFIGKGYLSYLEALDYILASEDK